MKPIRLIYLLCLFLFAHNAHAQLDITDATTAPFTPQNLIKNVLLGSGVDVTNVQYDGDLKAVGFFSGGFDNLNLTRGIVLSTADVEGINKPNNTSADIGSDDFTSGGSSDTDLSMIATDGLSDVAKYNISFVPAADTLRFRYVFASEEYPEFVCNGFNDVFGFFISGPDPNGGFYDAKNIALVPDPSDPTGLTFTNTSVSIDNVQDGSGGACPASFEDYYNINPQGTQNFKYDAYTSVFTAEAIVVPCQEYTIKLAIADVGDNNYGSAVFLEAKSFGTGTLEVSLNSLSVDGSLAEGCGTGALEFILPETADEDYIIDIEFFTVENAATPGVDYPAIPSQLIIPAGSNSVSIPLWAIQDGENEPDEIISFEIQVDICNRKRFEIIIRDDDLFKPILPDDITICDNETFLIDSELDPDFELPPDPTFVSNDTVIISPEHTAIYSDIIVSGVLPTIMSPNIIESVCILGLEHILLNDLDIFLIAPGGQFLELSTDNGFKPDNISDTDRYENTCFTPFASENINNGENLAGPIFDANPTYTGDFQPEGVWSDLWDTQNPTNGVWRLLVLDDENGFVGTLEGWSITFRSFYNLTYEWSSDPSSTLCTNCEDIEVSPKADTEYTLKIIDSYGCERSESINISVAPSIAEPNVSCGFITQNSIEVLWSEVSGILGYEVRIDGGAMVSLPSTELSYNFLSLESSKNFEIEVRAIGPICNSEFVTVSCRTDDCAKPSVDFAIVSEVTCPGGMDGAVNFSATGMSPFTFELNGESNATGIFTNANQGQNTFSVTDVTGCVNAQEFTMPGPIPFDLNTDYRLSDPCNVVSDITGSVNVSGGTPPYSYLWSDLTTNQEATNLSPATYFVTVTDSNDCNVSAELDIPMLEQFDYAIMTVAPLCLDESNGIAIINETSGNGPYSYEWEDGTTGSSNSNLAEGVHVVTVTDGLGCKVPKSFVIGEGAELSLDIQTVDISCLGQDDGIASAIVSGGVAPYNYNWGGGDAQGDTSRSLPPGTFNLVVTDANNCVVSGSFSINEPEGLEFQVEVENNLCFNGANAAIEVLEVFSPNGQVNISWSDGMSGFSRMDLPNGEYCFTLNDGTVCELTECILISSPDEIEIAEFIIGPSCENSTDGSILLTVTGGTTPYVYSWEGPEGNFPAEKDQIDITSGNYSVTISDANQCLSMKSFDVLPATPITVDQTVFPISCKGEATGKIFFAASGGKPPFQYNWTGPDGFTASSNNISDVKAGSYMVTYIDDAGCSGSQEFFIQEPDLALAVNVSEADTICAGSLNGQLSVNPQGGTPPYDILWSNNKNGTQNMGLSAGEYFVTITDSKACVSVSSGRIVELNEITLELDQIASSCFQTNDGSAQITSIAYGDLEASLDDFQIIWNSSPQQTSLQASNLVGGQSYSVVVTDKYGCSAQSTIEVERPEQVSAETISFQNVSCFNGADGELLITGTGGTGLYNYMWDGNAGLSTSDHLEMLRKGSYSVTVTDENGCLGYNQFGIEEPRPLSMDFRVIDVNCFEGSDGRAEAVVQGGVGPYTYLWTNNEIGKAIENVVSDQYNITVTDANGCTLTDSTKVEQPMEAIMVELEIEDVLCNGGRNGKISANASGGSGFYRYSLDGVEFSSSNKFTNLTAGNYSLYVNDFQGCVDTFPEIVIFEPNALLVDLGQDLVIPFGSTVTLTPEIFNNNGPLNFQWISANIELLSCQSCVQPIFNGEREASFELLVTDERGCTGRDFITIRLQNFSPLFVPSAFTPNGDDENDVLRLFGAGIEKINSFAIYDRWGEQVFSVTDLEMGDESLFWNGVFNGEQAPSGLYYWIAEAVFENGFKETFKGDTTLLK